ncbi:MAG: HupE/UreJ family protein [Phycisphaeraceae bacterium]
MPRQALRRFLTLLLPAGVLAITAGSAHAHAGHEYGSFMAGFEHPLHGLDHLLAMVTVGLLSARMAARRMWTLPMAFVGMMACGGLLALAWSHEGLIVFEWGIMLSVLIFGLIAAIGKKISLLTGSLIVAVFAICHGHAHVAEMGEMSALGYFPGMLLCTAGLHMLGLVVGIILKEAIGEWTIRAGGALIATGFALMLMFQWMG